MNRPHASATASRAVENHFARSSIGLFHASRRGWIFVLAAVSLIVLSACGGSAAAASSDEQVAESQGSDSDTRASALAVTDSWTVCATENQVCTVSGTQTVRYGVDGVFVSRQVTGSVSCSNAVFGDPTPGRVKNCESQGASASTTSTWGLCAAEGQVCTVSGTQTVRYGVDGAFVTRQVTGSVSCSNAVFGDPAVGRVKRCDIEGATSAPTASAWGYCAAEGEVCTVTGTRHVRYGVDTTYVSRDVTGSVLCSNSAFGDPAPGRVKHCDMTDSAGASSPAPAPVAAPSAAASGPGPLDVSSPTTVVGNGAASSCNEGSLRSAVANGGVITFNCGAGTATIALSQPLVAPTDKDTTIDGADRIVLDGQGVTQILRAYRADFRTNDRTLAVQRLTMTRGRDVGTGYVPRNGSSTCAWGYKEGGGGAIFTRDLNVRVWGVTFDGNRGPDIGPDVAGGAIYVFGAKAPVVINNSTFKNNSASNGGAIGLLHASSDIHNTVFENNRASGQLANFGGASGCPVFNHEQQGGAGGLGGAFYSDGFNTDDAFSRVRMSDNTANDLGGAVFRSAYWGLLQDRNKQTITWQDSRFERNRTAAGGGGAAYVNNSLFVLRGVTFNDNDAGIADGGALKITGATVQASDLTVSGNKANWGGGIAQWGGGPEGVGTAARINYANNLPQNAVGAFPAK